MKTPTLTLTAETITNSQIRALGIEAWEAGDYRQFDLTAAALAGDAAARQRCVDAINAARAQEGV